MHMGLLFCHKYLAITISEIWQFVKGLFPAILKYWPILIWSKSILIGSSMWYDACIVYLLFVSSK